MRKKKQVKVGFVLPYSIWDGLKHQPPQIIRDAIDCCVEYDKHWLETYPSGGDVASGKYDAAAMVVFGFAKPLIDANNRRYYERLCKKKDKATEDAEKPLEEVLDDNLPV